MCYEECGDCMVQVTKKLPHCEHTANMPCSMDPEKYLCKGKCSKMLPCGHPCPNKCYEECGNCQVKVGSKVVQSLTMMDIWVIMMQNINDERNKITLRKFGSFVVSLLASQYNLVLCVFRIHFDVTTIL
jgi:hypothetical protein